MIRTRTGRLSTAGTRTLIFELCPRRTTRADGDGGAICAARPAAARGHAVRRYGADARRAISVPPGLRGAA
jgi:hypothetical protein